MKHRSGFTIVELLVVIAMIIIISTLVVANLSSGQVKARDEERKNDVANIASYLEIYYNQNGSYPGRNKANNLNSFLSVIPDIDLSNLKAPGFVEANNAMSLKNATNDTQTTAGVAPQPQNNTYVYQAIDDSGTCNNSNPNNSCRKFIIYYKLEATGEIIALKSKNQ